MGKISVIVGGQYGSEAKGHCASWLASPEQNGEATEFRAGDERVIARTGEVVGVRIGGPNAGHVVVDSDPPSALPKTASSVRWALRQIPVAAVTNRDAQLVIAAGSEIDPAVLLEELDALDAAGYNASARLTIDPQATLIEPRHVEAERGVAPVGIGQVGGELLSHGEGGLTKRIGSTGKGVGAARADRLMRKAMTFGGFLTGSHGTAWRELCNRGVAAIDAAEYLRQALGADAHVVIEGTQGYGLGLHAGHYPYCTSGDARAIDFLAQAGINPWQDADWTRGDELDARLNTHILDVWVVLRPYPIRVAGNSGPLKDETSWEALGLPEERTTVTKKIRRVGGWDPQLARDAVSANGGSACKIFLSMADQVVPQIAGLTQLTEDAWGRDRLTDLVETVERDAGAKVYQIGTGPNTSVTWRS